MTRRGKIVGAGAAFVLVMSLAACGLLSVTKSSDHANYYFRLKADYSHDGQPVNFDIVVACSVRVDRYKGGDSGFLAARYPRFFVKETHDGHAVMQIVPAACRGETTANGIVPKDFLPGVTWFEKSGDYRFGIAYVSEDAFENPEGQLKFHGASIEKATHEDWWLSRKVRLRTRECVVGIMEAILRKKTGALRGNVDWKWRRIMRLGAAVSYA